MSEKEYDESGLPWIGGHRLFWTVTEYAGKTGTKRQNILAKIKRGTLKAVRVGNQWLIPESTS